MHGDITADRVIHIVGIRHIQAVPQNLCIVFAVSEKWDSVE